MAKLDSEEQGTRRGTSGNKKRKPLARSPRPSAIHETATIQLSQLTMRLQRGANDGAIAEASSAATLPPRLVLNALGQALYRIGLQAEYRLYSVWRVIRTLVLLLGKGIFLLARTLVLPLGVFFLGLWRDLTEPIARMFSGARHIGTVMREAKARGESPAQAGIAYFKRGVREYRSMLTTALSYLLPLAAAAVLGITVWSLLSTPYSLLVEYQGETLGYIENESVWEEAQRRVKDRIRAASSTDEFSAVPVLRLTALDVMGRSNASTLANRLIEHSTDQIQEATGLYIGSTLVGVCTNSADIQRLLDTTLNAANAANPDAVRVEYVHSMSLDSGLYYTSSIEPLSQLESTLERGNLLQVKVVQHDTYEQEVAYETITQDSEEYYTGVTRVQQRGINGYVERTDEVTYVDGVEVERNMVSETVLQEMQPRIVLNGTRELPQNTTYDGVVIQGSGTMMWPVPDYSYTTTEYGQGGHRGLDICAPYGSPVYACDSGTVIEAGWNGSWGYYVLIDHGNGITTRYAHNSTLLVVAGQNVTQGQNISLVGSTGFSFGNHCHLEVTVNGALTNPRRLVSP